MTENSPILQLAYVSRRAIGVSDEVIVDEIAIPSIRRNLEHSVTGCLWFNRDRFFQIIEGPAHTVDTLYDNIERDPRHTDCHALCRRLVTERAFSRWHLKVFHGDFPRDLNELLRRAAPGYLDHPDASIPALDRGDEPGSSSGLMGLLRGGLVPLQRVIAEMTRRDDHLPT